MNMYEAVDLTRKTSCVAKIRNLNIP